MGELRAYALGVTEVRGLAGAPGAEQARFRGLARTAYGSPRAPRVRDLLGPAHRRVPGAPVSRDDHPTPADLDALLAGVPVRPERSAATWRLVEALVAGLAWSSTRMADPDLPPGLLAPLGLPVPPVDGLVVGWCTPARARTSRALAAWLDGVADWSEAAGRAGRPRPDVIVFCPRA